MSAGAFVGRAALAASSAIPFGLAFPPYALSPFAWVALVPFFVALRLGGPRGGLALGAGVGVLHAYAVGTWFVDAITEYYAQSALFGTVFFFGMALLMVAPYYLLFALIYARLAERFDRSLPFLAAAAWVGAELLRGRLMTGTPFFIGNPWALLGYSQVGFDPAVQVASLTGVYGISFAIALVNAALAEVVLGFVPGRESARPRFLDLGLASLPAVAMLAFGAVVLRSAPPAGAPGATRLALVQGNLDNGLRWSSSYYGSNLETYLRLSAKATAEEIDLLVWPEAAMTFFVSDEPAYRAAIARVLGPRGVELVAGAPHTEQDGEGTKQRRFYNSVFVLDPRGEVRGRYDKQYLVPFSEYFPLSGIGFLQRRFAGVRTFEHGSEPAELLPTRAGRAGVVVCNEAMLPEIVSRRVAAGADYLLNPSNDSWVGDAGFAELQFDIVALRAVEQRRDLVRASTWGPSAVVDAWGRVVARSGLGTREVVAAGVHARRGRTLYSRVGDLFGVSCLVTAIGGFAIARREGR